MSEQLARLFHENYERLAPIILRKPTADAGTEFGYDTRKDVEELYRQLGIEPPKFSPEPERPAGPLPVPFGVAPLPCSCFGVGLLPCSCSSCALRQPKHQKLFLRGAAAQAPKPIDDIERLLRSYDSVNGYRLDARLLVRRVQRWLDSLPRDAVNSGASTPDL